MYSCILFTISIFLTANATYHQSDNINKNSLNKRKNGESLLSSTTHATASATPLRTHSPSVKSANDSNSHQNNKQDGKNHEPDEYIYARNIRTQRGHHNATSFYRSLLLDNIHDYTASSRIAAAYSTPVRHDLFFHTANTTQKDRNAEKMRKNDILEFRRFLDDCHFTHENIKRIFGIRGDKGFVSGPVYVKPVMAGASIGLPSFLEPYMDGTRNNMASLKCLISMFLLGYAVPESILLEVFPNAAHNISLLKRLNLIFQCELNPDLLVPYVQLFPLEIDEILRHNEKNNENKQQTTAIRETTKHVKNLVFVTDWHPNVLSMTTVGLKNDGAVMYIGPDSLALVQHFPQSLLKSILQSSYSDPSNDDTSKIVSHNHTTHILDFCSGSGIQAIVTLSMLINIQRQVTYKSNTNFDSYNEIQKAHATCYDVNERALRFIRFNTILNGFSEDNIEATKIDLLCSKTRNDLIKKWSNKVQIILANPPFIPVPSSSPPLSLTIDEKNLKKDIKTISEVIYKRYGLFSSGGTDGEDVLREIISLTPLLLNNNTGGFLAIVSEFMGPSDSPNLVGKRMNSWWKKGSQPLMNIIAGKGILFTNEFPVSATTYAFRRANDEDEFKIWSEHLKSLKIETVSPGLLFIKIKGKKEKEKEGVDDLDVLHYLVPKSNSGSIWTPHNKEAVKFTRQKFEEIMGQE